MIFLKLFIYMFYAYGLTTIMVYGRGPFGLCENIRAYAAKTSDGLGELFSCPMCFSTWVGMLTSLADIVFFNGLAFTPFNMVFASIGGFGVGVLVVFFDGFFTSGVVWLLHQLEEAMERHGVVYSEEFVEEADDEK